MDAIGRVVPGTLIIIASVLVIKGPNALTGLLAGEGSHSLTFSAMLLWGLVAYLLGLTLGQVWNETGQRIMEHGMECIRSECKCKMLNNQNQTLLALGRNGVKIHVEKLPPIFVMHDHLRLVVPAEAARLLKLRSEKRMSEVIFLGFSVLAAVNLWYLRGNPEADRVLLEIALAIVAVFQGLQIPRREKLFANGVCNSWFPLAASGRFHDWLIEGAQERAIDSTER